LSEAARELWNLRKVSKTVNPDSYAIITQAICDGLKDMAEIAEIPPDEAQLIFAKAQDEPAAINGHAAIDEMPPAPSPEDYGALVPATAAEKPIEAASFFTPAHWPDEPPPPVEWLARDRIPRGDVTTLHGDGGAGKTDIALRLAARRAAPVGDCCPQLHRPLRRGSRTL